MIQPLELMNIFNPLSKLPPFFISVSISMYLGNHFHFEKSKIVFHNCYIKQLMEQYDQQWKILILGSIQSPKLQLLSLITNSKKKTRDEKPVTVQYFSKIIKSNTSRIKLNFSDAPVNERVKSFFGTYFRGCNGLIFVFDSGSSASFLYIKKLLNNVKEIGFIDKAKLLISFESDEKRREVSPEATAAFALENDMMFQQVSHSSSQAVIVDLLGKFAKQILNRQENDSISAEFEAILSVSIEKMNRNQYYESLKRYRKFIEKMKDQYSYLRTELGKSDKRQTMLRGENDMLQSQIELLTAHIMESKAELRRIKSVNQKILEPLNSNLVFEVQEVVDLYEKESLKLRQITVLKQRQFSSHLVKLKDQCKQLESICDEFDGITIRNLTQKLNQVSSQYNKYKQNYCILSTFPFLSEEEGKDNFLILKGLNQSSIFEIQ